MSFFSEMKDLLNVVAARKQRNINPRESCKSLNRVNPDSDNQPAAVKQMFRFTTLKKLRFAST